MLFVRTKLGLIMSRLNRTSANTPSVNWSAFCLAALAVLSVSRAVQAEETDLRVNKERIEQQIMELANYGRNPEGGVSRVAFSDADIAGREYLITLMEAAGLEVRIDTAGNLIGQDQDIVRPCHC